MLRFTARQGPRSQRPATGRSLGLEIEFDTTAGELRLIGIQIDIQLLASDDTCSLRDRDAAGHHRRVGLDIHFHAIAGNGLRRSDDTHAAALRFQPCDIRPASFVQIMAL